MVDNKVIKKKTKKLTNDFKQFAFKEATLGAAVGIMLGAAFRDVINSLVNDVLTPPIAYITSGIDFTSLYFTFGSTKYESIELAREAGAVIIHYGNFISEFITFLITAFILFLLAYQGGKIVNRLNKKEAERKKSKEKKCPFCKSKIHEEATRCPFCTSRLENGR
jgi:large conductance mechanosensitive channel